MPALLRFPAGGLVRKGVGLIGRGPLKAGMLAFTIIGAAFVTAGSPIRPSQAVAALPAQHVVVFQSGGTATQHATSARTVGEFLTERGIKANASDFVRPSLDTPLADNLVVNYRAAVPVRIVTASRNAIVTSSAPDVGALLEEQHVAIGKYDDVRPSLDAQIAANSTIRVVRVTRWVETQRNKIAMRTIHKIDFTLPPGKVKVIAAGSAGERETMVRYTRTDYGSVQKSVVGSRIVRTPHSRVIAEGIGEYAAFAQLARRGLEKTSYIASSAMAMVATAYTAGCAGCSGVTASGYRAGHGIVAVDPSVIPLGTRLYIPGYGVAVAGDTGGAIHGNRIDLGFNSLSDALQFGRRTVTVYKLK